MRTAIALVGVLGLLACSSTTEPDQLSDDALPGIWTGTYTWNCVNANYPPTTGSTAVELVIGLSNNNTTVADTMFGGQVSFGSSAASSALVARRYSRAEFAQDGGVLERTPHPRGRIVEIEIMGAPGIINNYFTGTVEGTKLSGTVLNGNSSRFAASAGCTSDFGPAGTFSLVLDTPFFPTRPTP
jgi:hypothetical protein